MGIRFKIARFVIIMLDLLQSIDFFAVNDKYSSIYIFLSVVLLQALLLIYYLIRLSYLMRKYHRFEYDVHRAQLLAYGISTILIFGVKEYWINSTIDFDFSGKNMSPLPVF